MMQPTALQHLFTTVEKERSPTGRRGYQTLFYSKEGLGDADLQILETRSQYFSTPGDPVKLQFYWLPGDRWVVSQSVALAERDEFGRKGRYLTHNLILSIDTWLLLGCAPFVIWTAKPFISRLDHAFLGGDMSSGNIPAITLRLAAEWQDGAQAAARSWVPENLLDLARLAWRAEDLQTSGRYVALSGDQTRIGRVLLASYLVTPPDQRKFLTFDTHAVGCNWGSREQFWAQGFPPDERVRTSLVVNAAAHQVQTDATAYSHSRPYTRWMEEAVIPGRLDSLLAWQDWALALDGIIRGEPVEHGLLDGMDSRFVRQFADLSASELGDRVQSLLPANIPPRLAQPVLNQVGSTPYETLRRLMQGWTERDVLDMIYEALLLEAAPLSSADRKALEPLAESHAGLRGLLYLWSGNQEGWRERLDALGNQEYGRVVTHLLEGKDVPSWKMISPRHIDDWLHHCISYTHSNELVDVARALGECGGPAAVDGLAEYVPQLQPSEQKQLYKWLKKSYREQASQMWQALELALGKSGPSKGSLKGRLFGSRKE